MATTFFPAAVSSSTTLRVVWLLPHPVRTAVMATTGLVLFIMVRRAPIMVKSAPAVFTLLARAITVLSERSL